jgi:hypothetical protein
MGPRASSHTTIEIDAAVRIDAVRVTMSMRGPRRKCPACRASIVCPPSHAGRNLATADHI